MPVRFHFHQTIVSRRGSPFIPQFSIGASHKCQFLHLLAFSCTRDASKKKERLSSESIYKALIGYSIKRDWFKQIYIINIFCLWIYLRVRQYKIEKL